MSVNPIPITSEKGRGCLSVKYPRAVEQRRGALECQRDDADLAEIQPIGLLEQWIDRRNERLDQVVEEMRKTDRRENGERHASTGVARVMGDLVSMAFFSRGLRTPFRG